MDIEKGPPIPWAPDVKVELHRSLERRIDGVTLSIPDLEIEVGRSGLIRAEVDSRKNIASSMELSEELTHSLRRYKKADPHSFFVELVKDWLKGVPVIEEPPGVLDWWPDKRAFSYGKIGKIGGHGYGRITDLSDDWIGSFFPYVHFVLPDGEEGLAIDWAGNRDEEDFEVWLGYVDEFIGQNMEDFEDWETYGHYNETFSNGLLWALDVMDVFTRGEIPDWAVKIIRSNPDLLWPELVEKLLPQLRSLPEDLEKAVRTWMDRRRLERERETGQVYFWPKENQDG